MANTATQQIIAPAMVTLDQVGQHQTQPFSDVEARHVLTAHRMIEKYLGEPRPLSQVTATYAPTDRLAPLAAVTGYPINVVSTVLDGNNAAITDTSNDDRYIWSGVGWPATVVVQYVGGIEQPVFDALIRQSRVLSSRDDVSPEEVKSKVGGSLSWDWNPQYRSGLAPDVKQMLFPFRTIGF